VRVFLLHQLALLQRHYRVTVVLNTDDPEFLRRQGLAVEVIRMPIERRVRPVRDLRALWRLTRLLRRRRFDLVHSIMPKAGLLAMLSACMAGVPARLHTFTGQVWATRRGAARWLLKQADRITARCATDLLVDSGSQRAFLSAEGVVSQDKAQMLGRGSVCGVDLQRYRPDAATREQLRRELGISSQAPVFLYLGRLTRDKGALLMARAFAHYAERAAEAHLLVVGPDEDGLLPHMRRLCQGCAARVHFFGYTEEPERFMAAAGVLCMPSYREGFGNVFINAGAAGIPVIGSRIYGSVDAVVEGETGLLFTPGSLDELSACMERLAGDGELRARLGHAGRARAERDFDQDRVAAALLELYRKLLE
jgi:glycosyltransferase involved in cell wall biosynthesis